MSGGMETMHLRAKDKNNPTKTLYDRLSKTRQENTEVQQLLDLSSMLSKAQEAILKLVKDKQKKNDSIL